MKTFMLWFIFSCLFISCSNGGIFRLPNDGVCQPDADPAQFELFESEKSSLVEAASLPSDKKYSADLAFVTIERVDQNNQPIIMSLANGFDFTTTPELNSTCISGLNPNTPSVLQTNLVLPIKHDENGNLVTKDFSVDLNLDTDPADFKIITIDSTLTAADPKVFLESQGFTVKLYETPDQASSGTGAAYKLHAKSADGTTRVRISLTGTP